MEAQFKKDFKQFETVKLDQKQLDKLKGGGGGVNEDDLIIG